MKTLLALLLVPSVAFATAPATTPAAIPAATTAVATPAATETNTKPCAEDLQKFCKGLDKSETKKCLKKHLKEVSPACKKHINELKAQSSAKKDAATVKIEEVSEACKNVKITDPNFKECAKERLEIAKNKFRDYREKLKADRKAKLDKEKLEKEQKEKVKTE